MDRFNFFTRGGAGAQNTNTNNTTQPPPQNNNAYIFNDQVDDDPDYDDIAPLSPRVYRPPGAAPATSSYYHNNQADLEAQQHQAEMTERERPTSRFLPRFRPAIPSFFSAASPRRFFGGNQEPRPASSFYDDDGGPPADTVVNGNGMRGGMGRNNGGGGGMNHYGAYVEDDLDETSPKTPRFRIAAQDLPGARLHLPNLNRTWTDETEDGGHFSRPGTRAAMGGLNGVMGANEIAEPAPAVTAQRILHGGSRGGSPVSSTEDSSGNGRRSRGHRGHRHGHGHRRHESDRSGSNGSSGRRSRRRRGHDRNGSNTSTHSSRSGSGTSEEDEAARRRRRQRRRQRELELFTGGVGRREGSRRTRDHGDGRTHPKRFLFCFPWIKSRQVRGLVLRCFVSGMLLALLLSICKFAHTHPLTFSDHMLTSPKDLALSITKNINSSEFTILFILVILFITIFFCHGLIRLCMLIVRGGGSGSSSRSRGGGGGGGAQDEEMGQTAAEMAQASGGYAVPREPIRVVMARDEEAAGIESQTAKMKPPAYGLWRESVVCLTPSPLLLCSTQLGFV